MGSARYRCHQAYRRTPPPLEQSATPRSRAAGFARESAIARAPGRPGARYVVYIVNSTQSRPRPSDLELKRADYMAVGKQQATADKTWRYSVTNMQQVAEQVGARRKSAARRADQGAGRGNPASRARADRNRLGFPR